jgi:HSP20 family protein
MQEIPVKVYRSDDRVTVAAPMPGLEPQDIDVEVRDHELVLRGGLRGTLKGDKDVLQDEWNPGPYHREVRLPSGVDGEMANLTYNNGVLVVVLPVTPETRPAHLNLETISATQGRRVGNAGRPIEPPGDRIEGASPPADADTMSERARERD